VSDDSLSTEARRALLALSAALGAGSDGLDAALSRAAESAAPRAVEEALLQSYLFVGFPAALSGLARWRELRGTPPEPEDPAEAEADAARRETRGVEICRAVYGGAYERLRSNVARAHPAIDRWMIREGYGKVLGRPGLALAERELCIVALLAAAGWEPQLHSHLRGALRTGAADADIEEALEVGLAAAGDEEGVKRGRTLWRRVRARLADGGDDVR
jgi:4-carboxymuconolactone decarboxylase